MASCDQAQSSASVCGMLPLSYYFSKGDTSVSEDSSRRSAPLVIVRKERKRPVGQPRKNPAKRG